MVWRHYSDAARDQNQLLAAICGANHGFVDRMF
jgi:hypothetical protein